MSQHTDKIAKNLFAISSEKTNPLVVVIDNDNRYISHYGNLNNYDLPDFIAGNSCIDDFPFLVGLEEESYVVLPLVNFKKDITADVNIIKINQSRFVIMQDATQQYDQIQETTQVSNETKILNEKLKKLTEQLKETQLELKYNNEQLKLANNAKSRFISGMSHEFRTPISSVLGYSNILAEMYTEKDMEYRYAKAIERNTQYLLSLIDNVLEHAQLESDKLNINIAPFNLRELLNDVKLMFSTHARESNLVFNFATSETLPEVISTDRIRLQQILVNIISNAFKYTIEGSVDVNTSWENNKFTVAVSDTGPGILEEHRKSIFHAFNRFNSQEKKRSRTWTSN